MEKAANQQFSIEYFKNLIAIAAADGRLDENEKRFLLAKAEEFGLPLSEVTEIIKNPQELQFNVPKDKLNREEHLADIVIMSMVDGELLPEEYQLCVNIAEKLELDHSDVDAIVALIKRKKKKQNGGKQGFFGNIIAFIKGH